MKKQPFWKDFEFWAFGYGSAAIFGVLGALTLWLTS